MLGDLIVSSDRAMAASTSRPLPAAVAWPVVETELLLQYIFSRSQPQVIAANAA